MKPRPGRDSAPAAVALVVMAKEPRAGSSKTRLSPPCTPDGAAALAAACLADTLAAVEAMPGPVRRAVALDGRAGPWLAAGVEVIAQRGAGLDERMAAAIEDIGAPALLIGADTPQVTPAQLAEAVAPLARPDVDAVVGRARDGGFWCIGLSAAVDARRALVGIPMSRSDTADHQLARLDAMGLNVTLLPHLRDVDTIDDALAVAAVAPRTRFARALAEILAPSGGSG